MAVGGIQFQTADAVIGEGAEHRQALAHGDGIDIEAVHGQLFFHRGAVRQLHRHLIVEHHAAVAAHQGYAAQGQAVAAAGHDAAGDHVHVTAGHAAAGIDFPGFETQGFEFQRAAHDDRGKAGLFREHPQAVVALIGLAVDFIQGVVVADDPQGAEVALAPAQAVIEGADVHVEGIGLQVHVLQGTAHALHLAGFRVQLGEQHRLDLDGRGRARAVEADRVGGGQIEVQRQVHGNAGGDHQPVAIFQPHRSIQRGHRFAVGIGDGRDLDRAAVGAFHLDVGIAVIQREYATHIDPGGHRGGGEELGHVGVAGKVDTGVERQGLHHGAVGLGQGQALHIDGVGEKVALGIGEADVEGAAAGGLAVGVVAAATAAGAETGEGQQAEQGEGQKAAAKKVAESVHDVTPLVG